MFGDFHQLISIILAIVLTISPHLLRDNNMTPDSVQKMAAEAQLEAQRIIETGDTSKLKEVEAALVALEKYQPIIDKLAPVMGKIVERMGVNVSMTVEEKADIERELNSVEKEP